MEREPQTNKDSSHKHRLVQFKFMVNGDIERRSIRHPGVRSKITEYLADLTPTVPDTPPYIAVDIGSGDWLAITTAQPNDTELAGPEAFMQSITALERCGFSHFTLFEATQLLQENSTIGKLVGIEKTALSDVTAEMMQFESDLRTFQPPT